MDEIYHEPLSVEDIKKMTYELLRISNQQVIELQQFQRHRWDQLAGPCAELMLQCQAATERYLEHPDPKLRIAATEVISEYWKAALSYSAVWIRMFSQDPDPVVRRAALSTYIGCYTGSDDPEVGHMLAALVKNESLPDDFRVVAYDGLFCLRDLPQEEHPLISEAFTGRAFRFPQDVDNSFVDSFR
jgi:hypothetical protein